MRTSKSQRMFVFLNMLSCYLDFTFKTIYLKRECAVLII